jgi:hypothetical protein
MIPSLVGVTEHHANKLQIGEVVASPPEPLRGESMCFNGYVFEVDD